jgi:murein DD-endopeptidase MepM/ murein hydrolase activator NlpD
MYKLPFKDCTLEDYPQGNVTQWFGENVKLYKSRLGLAGHNGIDLVNSYGTPILAVSKQKVCEVKNSPEGYGRHVRCIDDKYEYTYGHLSRLDVKIGQKIKAGQQLGLMGNSGFVVSGATPFWEFNPFAGTHLHFGIRKFKPYSGSGSYNIQYQSKDKGTILGYTNGYKGSVDPMDELWSQTIDAIDKEIKTIQLSIISLLNQIIALLERLKVLQARKEPVNMV